MFTKNGPEFQCLKGKDQNSNLYKIRTEFQCLQRCGYRIPMPLKKRPNFQCLERYDQKTNVYKKGLEFQSLEGKGQNSKVHKNRARIPMSKRIKS